MNQIPRLIVDGPINASYGQMYLASGDVVGEEHFLSAFAGQTNGLCGGSDQGVLSLRCSSLAMDVPISVHVHDTPPPIDHAWEEIVEAPFTPLEGPVHLYGCGGNSVEVPIPTEHYRARCCASGLVDLPDIGVPGETSERYLLILWPEARRPDEIIKQTSKFAKYLHNKVWPSPAP